MAPVPASIWQIAYRPRVSRLESNTRAFAFAIPISISLSRMGYCSGLLPRDGRSEDDISVLLGELHPGAVVALRDAARFLQEAYKCRRGDHGDRFHRLIAQIAPRVGHIPGREDRGPRTSG